MKIFQLIDWLTKLFKLNNKAKVILLLMIPAFGFSQNAFWIGKKANLNLLFDDYPGAAAAYSVRKLDKDYTGFAMEIRRASDNTTQNIGFVGEDLDEVAINSFCSGTTCYVRTWYDQSGNSNNATQSIAANQPKIYDSVTELVTENGKPSIQFNNDYLIGNWSTLFSTTTDNIYFCVLLKFDDISFTQVPFRQSDGGNQTSNNLNTIISAYTSNQSVFYRVNSVIGLGLSTNISTEFSYNQTLISLQKNGSTGNVYRNGILRASAGTDNTLEGNVPINTSFKLYIGINGGYGITNSSTNLIGKIQELFIYSNDKNLERTAIETNINSYYSIY